MDEKASLEQARRQWDELAALDPLWAILSYRRMKFGRWDQDEFFAEGERHVERLLERARQLGHPQRWESALDFGCGVGRLAPALAANFSSYVGVDLSEGMIGLARKLHTRSANCTFVVSTDESLGQFGDSSFDLIFTLYVHQHMTRRRTIHSYLRGMLRLLRVQGLLVFQLPARVPRPEKLLYDTRRALYIGLRALGMPQRALYRYLGLHPMTMNFVPEKDVLALLEDSGAEVLDVEASKMGFGIRDRTYYVTKAS